MGNANSCVRHLKDVFSSLRGGSSESEIHQTAPAAREGERATSSSPSPLPCAGSEGAMERTQSGKRSEIEDRIESSKVHWSQLAEPAFDSDDEEVEADDREVFRTLESHPTWGYVFCSCDYFEDLSVGEKFAEGGQAELFHAKVIWRNPNRNEEDREDGREWALKVFKKGILLRHLQSQWPDGFLQFCAEQMERDWLNLPPLTHPSCAIQCGTLLEDGRFAFLMAKEHEDLRSLIDRTMLSIGEDHGPFSKDEAERIMFMVAQGMDWLHSHNIVHRDLKAANVLLYQRDKFIWLECCVADFECSIGVVGTGFFRAPEILQVVKNKVINERPEVFSKEADVYSYGMTCYEILTGELPFEGHPIYDFDIVLKEGQRPKMSDYVDDWVQDLLSRCWQEDPTARPLFGEIMNILSANSAAVRELQLYDQKWEEEWEQKWEQGKMRELEASLLPGDLVVEPQY